MEKNAKIGTFFYKEGKRMQRSERSFIKNEKERKDQNVLLKRTDAQPWELPLKVRIIPAYQRGTSASKRARDQLEQETSGRGLG